MNATEILRAISERPQTTAQLQGRFSAVLAKPHVAQMLQRMYEAGKIAPVKRGWQLTALGIASLPKAMPKRDWGVYVPPTRNWRPGSDVALSLPSLFAGERVYR
jgi:hypothetical protein